MVDRSTLSISSGVLLMVHSNSIGPTSGYCSLHINIVQTSSSFFNRKEYKMIVDLHLWMAVDSRFHAQINHWLVEGCCAFYSLVS